MLFTKHTLFRTSAKSGMATVLGMLIFIGVIFTCVIPLFLYVNQVNSMYDTAVTVMRQFDQDREKEQVDVYTYPLEQSSNTLSIYIKNRSPFSVKIVRVWINNESFSAVDIAQLPLNISAMGDGTIESIDIQDMLPGLGGKEFYRIKATTSRGNLFSSFTNPLCYTDGFGWSGRTGLTVYVVIQASGAPNRRFYNVKVANDPVNATWFYEIEVVKEALESSCFAVVAVDSEGDYYVTVKKGEEVLAMSPSDGKVYVGFSQPSQQWVYAYDPD